MNNKKVRATHLCVIAAATALIAGGAGCSSHSKKPAHVDQSADLSEHNRLLVRMALAENVYNGVAAERAVYAKDFIPGTATLNELGTRRVEMLLAACRGASGSVVIVKGDEADELYDARVAAVRQQFADAGPDLEKIAIAKGGHVGGSGESSDRAILNYQRMITARPQTGAADVGMQVAPTADSNNNTPKGR